MASNAQHNFAAIQLQLQTLQFENSALTKDVCLKENYIQLKDQQFRVMQKRLEDLESAVATWKDKYLQQLNHQATANALNDHNSSATTVAVNPNEDDSAIPSSLPRSSSNEGDKGTWVLWKGKLAGRTAGASAKNVQQALGMMEKLSSADREKLKPMLAAITNSDGFAEALSSTQWEEVFGDVSEELSKILLLYLLPVLLENQKQHTPGSSIQCFSRTYAKQTMDFRIVCLPGSVSGSGSGASPLTQASQASPAEQTKPPAAPLVNQGSSTSLASTSSLKDLSSDRRPPPYMRSLSSSANTLFPLGSPSTAPSEFSSVIKSAELAEANGGGGGNGTDADPPHLFDCVDSSEHLKRNPAAPVPHGPRELHATKAVYISKPVASTGATSGTVSTSASAQAASRRYSLTPSRASTMSASESSRTATMTSMGSPYTGGGGGLSITDVGDGDRRSGGASFSGMAGGSNAKDGKIKKVLGSVMDRLNRHKPQLTTANPSLEDDESVCDGCGRGPIAGLKWICRTCRLMDDKEYELCEKCYGQGIHGKENEDALFTRIEEIVISKCSRLAGERELMKLLRVGICKANLKKFSFCLTWIADLLQCKQTKELRARALEISQIAPQVRSEFVRLLTDLLARYRKDIELITEWQPVQATSAAAAAIAAAAVVGDDGKGGVAVLQLDTLRIWVKDSPESIAAAQQQ